jgi:MoxR-like ATPase
VRARTDTANPLSTRSSLALIRMARARALSAGRGYVEPDDVQAVAVPALAHRILDSTNDDLRTARVWIANFLAQVPAPPVQGA